MDIRLYLENGDGYIGLIYVSDITNNNRWQAIAHYPQKGTPVVYDGSIIDNAVDGKKAVELFCQRNGIIISPVEVTL